MNIMENVITVHIERLPEGCFLATSKDVQGLVAQGRTITETLEIARDVAKKLLELQAPPLPNVLLGKDAFDLPLVIGV